MKINVVFPFIPKKPGGGLRVLFEYANKLADFGHEVTIYYPGFVNHVHTGNPILTYLKFIYRKVFEKNIPDWFNLNKSITVKYVRKINDNAVDNGDIILSTWWALVFELEKLSTSKGIRFNLVQDIENWAGNSTKVKDSYCVASSNNVVIAKYLYHYLNEITGSYPYKISLAIDSTKYLIYNPITNRNPLSICMMYSTEPRKGSDIGLKALKIVKNARPNLEVNLFSIYDKPNDLPDWITYHYKNSKLEDIYNSSAIFLGPSVQEGCALPPMEAMYCGCAVVCSNIDGHKDYAFDNETAIFALSGNAEDMALKIENLLVNIPYREKIANQGNSFISTHTWHNSAKELERAFNTELKKHK
jgi:glycosyltransferase involved in cell wall biosynthesis